LDTEFVLSALLGAICVAEDEPATVRILVGIFRAVTLELLLARVALGCPIVLAGFGTRMSVL
jgi:hypothetical protein